MRIETALEDRYWLQKSKAATQEGFIGTEQSEKLLQEILNAED